MAVIKKCLECGKEFKARQCDIQKGWGIFCSYQCHNISMRKKEKVSCLYCGEEFEVWPYRIKMGYAKYCSNICRKKDKEKEKVLRVCALCNKEFWVIHSEITRGGGKYCSRDCTYKGKIKKIKTKCLVCAKDIDVTPAHKERGNGQFCSYTCATIWRNRNQKKRDTKIELLLKEWLIENEIEFTPQYDTGYGSVDFFIPPDICLFADGDYWHGPKLPEQLERDALQNENLKMKGFNVIRLKENEIKQGKRPTEIIEYYNKYKEKNKLGGV